MLPTLSSLFLSLSIALGAIGTHLLQGILTTKQLQTFETATFYLLIQSIAILALSLIQPFTRSFLRQCLWVSFIGVLIFSSSLYLYLLTNLIFWVKVTPIGGFSMILSWTAIGIHLLKNKNKNSA